MMSDRRQWLRLAAAAVLLPAVSASPARAAPGRFAPPAVPMLYTRLLRREMTGGAAMTVKRGFAVRFLRDGLGYRLEGEQVEVEVAAPDALAQFAQLERERQEVGLFPIALDAHGRIYSETSPATSLQLDAAVREASARLDAAGFDAGQRAELGRFVSQLHQTATRVMTNLPADLFAPVEPESAISRGVALPDGGAGLVTVRFSAQADPATGLMRTAMREVLTDLSGDRRRTVEEWSLATI